MKRHFGCVSYLHYAILFATAIGVVMASTPLLAGPRDNYEDEAIDSYGSLTDVDMGIVELSKYEARIILYSSGRIEYCFFGCKKNGQLGTTYTVSNENYMSSRYGSYLSEFFADGKGNLIWYVCRTDEFGVSGECKGKSYKSVLVKKSILRQHQLQHKESSIMSQPQNDKFASSSRRNTQTYSSSRESKLDSTLERLSGHWRSKEYSLSLLLSSDGQNVKMTDYDGYGPGVTSGLFKPSPSQKLLSVTSFDFSGTSATFNIRLNKAPSKPMLKCSVNFSPSTESTTADGECVGSNGKGAGIHLTKMPKGTFPPRNE